jgi:SAM-dependent methyltransferase
MSEFTPDNYYGHCAICGHEQIFERSGKSIRETYPCTICKASLREREQAHALILAQHLDNVKSIAEPGTIGPFRKYFMPLPNYCQSDYQADTNDNSIYSKIQHQDIEALTFEHESFDMIITSDILEHVKNPKRAFKEIARVLRKGGLHIFTVPMQDPLPLKSLTRVSVTDTEEIHLLPAHYHGNGKSGKSLVYTDFGVDIVMMLSDGGFATCMLRPATDSLIANSIVTFVSQRMF